MLNLMIAYANSAGDRWAAWVVAASLDAAVLLALVGLVWLAIRQSGRAAGRLLPLPPGPAQAAGARGRDRPGPGGAVDSFGPGLVVVRRGPRPRGAGSRRRSRRDRRVGSVRSRPSPAPSSTVAADFHRRRRPRPNRGRRSRRDPRPMPRLIPSRGPCPVDVGRIPDRLAGRRRRCCSGGFVAAQIAISGAAPAACPPLDESTLAVDLRELCRRAGVPETIRIVEDDSVAVPAVWGIARPTIILPRGIAAILTAEQLRWVLLHELAHVRRRDLIVLALQRFAAILHFFNPAIWIANRIIDQLREYACDDLASALSRRLRGRVRRGVRADPAACRSRPPRSGRGPRRLRPGCAGRLFPAASAGCWIPSGRSAPRRRLVALRPDPPRRRLGAPSAVPPARRLRPVRQAPAAEAAGQDRPGIRAARRGAGRASRSPRPSSSWCRSPPDGRTDPQGQVHQAATTRDRRGDGCRGAARGRASAGTGTISTCSSDPGLRAVLGGLVVRDPCRADPAPLHRRAGGRPGRWGESSSTPTASRSQA